MHSWWDAHITLLCHILMMKKKKKTNDFWYFIPLTTGCHPSIFVSVYPFSFVVFWKFINLSWNTGHYLRALKSYRDMYSNYLNVQCFQRCQRKRKHLVKERKGRVKCLYQNGNCFVLKNHSFRFSCGVLTIRYVFFSFVSY